MKHAGTAFLVVMLLSTLGLWGIAQQKNGAYASRLRDLEARHSKIEEEQRSFAAQAEKTGQGHDRPPSSRGIHRLLSFPGGPCRGERPAVLRNRVTTVRS